MADKQGVNGSGEGPDTTERWGSPRDGPPRTNGSRPTRQRVAASPGEIQVEMEEARARERAWELERQEAERDPEYALNSQRLAEKFGTRKRPAPPPVKTKSNARTSLPNRLNGIEPIGVEVETASTQVQTETESWWTMRSFESRAMSDWGWSSIGKGFTSATARRFGPNGRLLYGSSDDMTLKGGLDLQDEEKGPGVWVKIEIATIDKKSPTKGGKSAP